MAYGNLIECDVSYKGSYRRYSSVSLVMVLLRFKIEIVLYIVSIPDYRLLCDFQWDVPVTL